MMRLGIGEKSLETSEDFSRQGRINHILEKRLDLISKAEALSGDINPNLHSKFTWETAGIFFTSQVESRWNTFVGSEKAARMESYPFVNNLMKGYPEDFEKVKSMTDPDEIKQALANHYEKIRSIFSELEKTRVMELLRHNNERGSFLMNNYVKIMAMTTTHFILKHEEIMSKNFQVGSIIFEEAGQVLDFEAFAPISLWKGVERIIMIGDDNQLPPLIKNPILQTYSNLHQSMFQRLLRLKYPTVQLTRQGRWSQELWSLFQWKYNGLSCITEKNVASAKIAGLKHAAQFINVDGNEFTPHSHYYQNLEEAEYCVALYMYLILQGHSKEDITILTTYRGQKDLIREISMKSSWHSRFGSPRKISTIDKYQGQQNKIVILSLVRTKNPGFITNERRLVVALSRAREGFYIVGKVNLFKNQKEFNRLFENFQWKTHNLMINSGNISDTSQEVEVKSYKDLYSINLELFKNSQ